MLIYEGTKDNFLVSVEQDTIAIEIEILFMKKCIVIRQKMNSEHGKTPWNICIRS